MVTDFEKALGTLTSAGVEFIVIGGVAGALHGSAFLTQDLAVIAELQAILQKSRDPAQ